MSRLSTKSTEQSCNQVTTTKQEIGLMAFWLRVCLTFVSIWMLLLCVLIHSLSSTPRTRTNCSSWSPRGCRNWSPRGCRNWSLLETTEGTHQWMVDLSVTKEPGFPFCHRHLITPLYAVPAVPEVRVIWQGALNNSPVVPALQLKADPNVTLLLSSENNIPKQTTD